MHVRVARTLRCFHFFFPFFAFFTRRGGVRHRLSAAEHAALVQLGDHVGDRLLVRQHFGGVGLGIVLRPVAEAVRVGVVVPGARVARDAVDDLELDAGAVDADRHQLREVARAEPDRQPALVDRLRVDVADAHHEHLHAVLVGVEAAQRLAEHLRHAVAAVGLRVGGVVDLLVAAVEAHRVVAGREQDALDAVPARRLEHVVAADDVGLQDPFPRPLDRVAAEVHDGVDALW